MPKLEGEVLLCDSTKGDPVMQSADDGFGLS